MAKYRALVDVPPGIVAGQIVSFKEPLVDGYKPLFTPVTAEEAKEDGVKTVIANPSRDELKARAAQLEITFASNTPTDKLIDLIKEKEAELEAAKEAEGENDDSDDKEADDGEGADSGEDEDKE